MNDFIELRRVIIIVIRRWWVLIMLALVGAMIGYTISRQQTPVYQATTTVLVGESIRSSRVDRVDIQISEALIQTYVEIARRQPVMQGVVTTLNLNESWQSLSKRVTVTPIESTQLIEISVEANSPESAKTIADEIVNQLILLSPSSSGNADNQLTNSFNREQITKLQERIVNGQQRLAEIETAIDNSSSESELATLQQEKTNLEGLIIEWERNYTQLLTLTEPKRDPTQLTVIEPAHSSDRMVRPRLQLNTILGGSLGMLVAFGLIFLLDFLDDTYRSLKDFVQPDEVNILGSIRRIKGRQISDKIIAHLQPHSPITESYRIMRSRIRFRGADNLARSIMVTSSMPEEGKSVTAANLAVVFAQANFKTVIVDADLRHPVLHEVFDVVNETGLGDLLSSHEMKIEACLRNTSVENLQILTSGKTLPDPSSQLGSGRIQEIILELKKVADVVIFDSPPVLVFADAIVLSRRIDGVILVIQAGKSKRGAVNQTLIDLQNANANLLGSVFNRAPKSDTFSVNKVYMQEWPPVPFARAWRKKQNQFHGLRDAAIPLSQSPELPGLVSEKTGIDVIQIHNLDASKMPAIESLEISSSPNGSKYTKSNIPEHANDTEREMHTEPAQIRKLNDVATPANGNQDMSGSIGEEASDDEQHISDIDDAALIASEYLAIYDPESERASLDEVQTHDLDSSVVQINENLEISGSDSETATIAMNESSMHNVEVTALANETLEMSNWDGEKASTDEIRTDDLDESTMPVSENGESFSLDNETQIKDNESNSQPKRKRRRKSKRKELRSEGAPIDSADVAVEEADE